jgi:hypothetical protein
VVEDAGVLLAVLEVVLDGVLAGAGAGADAGAEGAAGVAWSDVVDAVSFFSPVVVGVGASLPADGFILSE